MTLSPAIPIVVGASAPFETPAPVNAHQVARRLAARGHDTLFVESTGLRAPALGSVHDLRRIAARLVGYARGPRERAPHLAVLSPLAPPQAGPRALRSFALERVAGQVQAAARRRGMTEPILWAFLPTAVGWADRLRARLVVYHCVDHYAANPGADPRWVDALEARMLARADVVFATSEVLVERLRRAGAPGVKLMPNVADVARFTRALEPLAEPAALAGAPRPRAVYVGNLAGYKVDFDLLHAVADAGLTLVLAGASGLGDVEALPAEARRLLARRDVRALGPLPHEDLPALLRHCDVALVPFRRNDHTLASLPLKLWEYVAAGLPVVATDLPNLRGPAAEGAVALASDAGGFAALAREAAARSPEARPVQSARARGHDWQPRMEELCGAVARALDSTGSARRVGSFAGASAPPPGRDPA